MIHDPPEDWPPPPEPTWLMLSPGLRATVTPDKPPGQKQYVPFTGIHPLPYEENIQRGDCRFDILKLVRALTDKEFEKLNEMFSFTSYQDNICRFPPGSVPDKGSEKILHYRYLSRLRNKNFAKPVVGAKGKFVYNFLNLKRGMWVINPHYFKPVQTDMIVELWEMLT